METKKQWCIQEMELPNPPPNIPQSTRHENSAAGMPNQYVACCAIGLLQCMKNGLVVPSFFFILRPFTMDEFFLLL